VNGQSECWARENTKITEVLKTGQGVSIATKYNRGFTIFIVNVRNVPITTFPELQRSYQ
jgi:hypothetical protein